jgi:competence protein CoiA
MKFSLVNGIKQEPSPKLKGICCHCGSVTQAKCGNKKVWHWAHVNLENCDPWWESETDWHRLWKGYFPSQNQEIIHFDDETGEKHIADIKTDNRMVIEVQNSPMNEAEMSSREHFYKKMMWIVNGEKFKNNFTILGKLPDPKSELAQNTFFNQPSGTHWGVKDCIKDRNRSFIPSNSLERVDSYVTFHLRSDNPNYEEEVRAIQNMPSDASQNSWESRVWFQLPQGEDRNRVLEEIPSNYVGHHLFLWKNSRDVWFQCTKPVFLDFGGNELWRLMDYDFRGLKCVRRISKKALIEKNGGCYIPVLDEGF